MKRFGTFSQTPIEQTQADSDPSVLSHEAGAVVKQEGKPNDLLLRIQGRDFFKPILPDIAALTDPATFTGRSAKIVERLMNVKVKPALERYRSALENITDADLKV